MNFLALVLDFLEQTPMQDYITSKDLKYKYGKYTSLSCRLNWSKVKLIFERISAQTKGRQNTNWKATIEIMR